MKGPIWVVKAQIHAGGRGKGGGVKVVNSIEDVHKAFNNMMGMNLVTKQTGSEGKEVKRIYIEDGCKIKEEFYLSYLIDRKTKSICLIASSEGGMDIEEVAEKTPHKIAKIFIDPATNKLSKDDVRKALDILKLERTQFDQLNEILSNILKLFIEKDASLIEINPFVLTEDNQFLCLDAKMNFDSNALFRHEEILALRDLSEGRASGN